MKKSNDAPVIHVIEPGMEPFLKFTPVFGKSAYFIYIYIECHEASEKFLFLTIK